MAVVGIDIGYGYTKAVSDNGEIRFQSVTGPAVRIKFRDELHRNDGQGGNVYNLNGRSFFVGNWALLQSPFTNVLRARERTDTEHLLRLFIAALHKLGIADKVKIVTGLPVAWYDDHTRIEAELGKRHIFSVDDRRYAIEVEAIYVIPQPIGSFFYLMLDDSGKLVRAELGRARVAVIDIGMYTTDYCLVDHLRYVERSSGSIAVGMGRVYDLVGDALREFYDLELELHQIDRAVRENLFRVNGTELAIEYIAEPAIKEVSERIIGKARELWGNARDVDRIILTGGGAIALRKRFTELYPQLILAQPADIANARGFYRRGRRMWANGSER